jgi:hypothetical protein
MTDPKILKNVKKCCIHESGHAVLAFHFGTPIHFVEMEIKIDGKRILYSGMVEHDMDKFIEDYKKGYKKFRSWKVFTEYLVIMWAGMAAESMCYPRGSVTWAANDDLNRINGMLKVLPKQFKNEERHDIGKVAAGIAKEIIQENRPVLEKLADRLFNRLIVNNFSIKVEGTEIEKFLSSERR